MSKEVFVMKTGMLIGNQIIIMFIILLIGAFCYLKGIITKDGTKQLSSVALNIVNPVLIFMSYQSEYDKELVHGLLWSFLLSAISYAVTILLTYVLIRKKTPDLAVERVSSIYSNCAFMCIPLINGIYGSEGVLYLTAYLTFFNLLIWTHGLMTMKGERDFSSLIKALLSPSVLSVFIGLIFYLTNIRLPSVPASALQYIADMNTPMAMIIAGATAAQTNVLKALQNKRLYYVSLCKLIILPAAAFFVTWLLSPPPVVLMTVTIAAACPSATMCTMFAVNLDKNPKTASEIFTVTTILSAVTLPLMTIFCDKLTYHM
ncbi:AEC family transporter [Ruminococcus sp.]|uniref:AEC family transporter n=1 Tax=Ruminococcus sp. TaxID=41978 RepID=UPI0025E2DDBB|nr:AEC family transporter [Ruminococcus sp.]